MGNDLLDLLAHELGEIYYCEEECPGVYYLSILPTIGEGGEYYAVLEGAPITQDTRTIGRKLEDAPAIIYRLKAEDGASAAVEYEILRYKAAHGLPMPEGKSLRVAALYGAELRPDYFGAYPVPFLTPWGHTLRHRPLDNGIYWIETNQCVEVLAVCYPIWDGDLSEGLWEVGQKLDAEGEMGYIYFLKETACVAIWELLRLRPALLTTGLIRKAELMNAIWANQPGYALGYNAEEQAGLHGTLGLLLYALGMDGRKLEGSPEHMIMITPDAGTDLSDSGGETAHGYERICIPRGTCNLDSFADGRGLQNAGQAMRTVYHFGHRPAGQTGFFRYGVRLPGRPAPAPSGPLLWENTVRLRPGQPGYDFRFPGAGSSQTIPPKIVRIICC